MFLPAKVFTAIIAFHSRNGLSAYHSLTIPLWLHIYVNQEALSNLLPESDREGFVSFEGDWVLHSTDSTAVSC